MADHNLPTVSSTYTNVLAQIDARLDDIALGLNSAHVAATNLPTNSIRWNASSAYWEKYNGTSWAALSSTYNININGTIGVTTPNIGAFTTLSTSGVAALAASSTVGGSLIVTIGGTHTFTGVQTFTNSTSPIIVAKVGPTAAFQHALPSVTSDTVTLLAATQTLTNKTYNAGALSGIFSGDHTLSGSVSFTHATAGVIVTTIGGNATQRHTLPLVASDTLVLLAATQSLTNKTLGSGTVYNGGTIGIAYGGTGSTTATGTGSVVLATSPTIASPTFTAPVLGTPASGTLTNCTFPTLNQSTTGTANNITAFTVNQNVGSSNTPTFAGMSLTGKLNVSNGTAASPSIAFTSDGSADTGLYWTLDGYINFSNNGSYTGNIGPGGSLTMAGNITAYGSSTAPSDIRLKTNITKIENALDKVCQLGGYTFDRTDRVMARQTGVIAQEVQKVLPEAIVQLEDENKTLTVAYGNMVGLLIEAIKELREELRALK
jgi:hypothetical protein